VRVRAELRVGDKVVHHGAAVIELEEKELFGESVTIYPEASLLRRVDAMVQTDSTDEVGLRKVTPAKEVPKVFGDARAASTTTNTVTNWSRRFKANVEKFFGRARHLQGGWRLFALHQRDK